MNTEKTKPNIKLVAYLLVFVGYMTLTLSLPLLGMKNVQLPSTALQFQYGISALFLLFSLSAIVLSRIADLAGVFQVLRLAQPISIAGLIVTACAPNFWVMDIGLCLMGLGTGCYSSIARLLIAKYSANVHILRKSFSVFSILIIIAPLFSTYLIIYASYASWRVGYSIMAIIEIALLAIVASNLKSITTQKHPIRLLKIIKGYTNCLKISYYTLNMLTVGVGIALIISIFLGLSHQLLVQQYHLSNKLFTLFNSITMSCYILGILFLRVLPNHFNFIKLRTMLVGVLIVTLVWFDLSTSLISTLLALYFAAFSLGGIVPLSTSAGQSAIKKHHGAAAALYTFSFAIISAIWSTLNAHLALSPKAYISLVFLISTILIAIFVGLCHFLTVGEI